MSNTDAEKAKFEAVQPCPHQEMLKEWRAQTNRLAAGLPDDEAGTVPYLKGQIFDLREAIIDTRPKGKAGVLAQVALLRELAWSDPVRRLTNSLDRSIRELWPD
ncbi:MAG: hypothetical protein ACR2RF_24095 [Geminicoccaceae bacterium]